MMRHFFRLTLVTILIGIALGLGGCATTTGPAQQQALVDDASASFSSFMRDPNMRWLQQNIGYAKGVLIAPTVVKAGFIFGGSGGRAVLFAKDAQSGRWVGPAFYALLTASVGFQAGVSVSESVTLVMTDRGLNALLSPSFKMGGDASIAFGPIGAGAQSNIVADLVAFSRDKGLYGGLNLEGTLVNTSDDWNQAYYGKRVLSTDILIRMSVHEAGADKLIAEITRAAGSK
jgi:lipid-binding SYLF domain-containing protein